MSIRARLALCYTAVLGMTLVISGVIIYSLMERHLIDDGDQHIATRARHVVSTIRVAFDPNGEARTVELPPFDAFESPGVYVQAIDPDGSVIARSANLAGQELPGNREALDGARAAHGVFYTGIVGEERVRVYIEPLLLDDRLIGFVQIGRTYREAFDVLDRLRLSLLGAGLISLVLAGGVAWGIAQSALRPVAAITRTARAIALSRGFSRRLEHTGARDELGELGNTFNEMLASLEEAYATQQRFIADASHELRAPLTAVRANLELLARRGAHLPEGERRALIEAAAKEGDRMARLVVDLLSLARADAGQQLQLERVELDRVLLEVYAAALPLAKGIRLAVTEIDQIALPADRDRLKQVMLILVDNAVRYTPRGEVRLSLRAEGAVAVLEVADTGIGIAAEDLPHVFERFYRADKARARDTAGTGLGLAIAQWIVGQHGGAIAVRSAPGSGTAFTVRLPLRDGRGKLISV